jgi:hypothetical protein
VFYAGERDPAAATHLLPARREHVCGAATHTLSASQEHAAATHTLSAQREHVRGASLPTKSRQWYIK